ncbi:MAG: 2Fe-2S iron-sulfur cluster-binding protein, partial [Bacteroidota bacterium]
MEGSEITTIEGLAVGNKLHPVQEALVEEGAIQCGFCTPGIVMSLFSLYKNKNNPSRSEIDDSLTGNLCRCTGYKPIIEAAANSCVNEMKDHFTNNEPQTAKLLISISSESIQLQTEEQNYYQPISLREALEFKNKFSDAIVINGATDIALRVTKKHELLKEIIDLSRVEELKTFSVNKSETRI